MNFEDLMIKENTRVIFRGVWGSHAFGTATETSDRDSVGVFMLEKARYLSLIEAPRQVSDGRNDNTYYSLRNYLALAANANPNILDSLFLPEDCVLTTSPYWEMIQERRECFISQRASQTYCEYAMSQIKKAKGCNKRVHHPQPAEPPTEDDFCRVILLDSHTTFPGRPQRLGDVGISLTQCHVAAVENSSEMFRLYDFGSQAKGVFRSGTLVCESIPKEDERARFIGLLLFNKHGFVRAKNEHRQYWDWYRNRNAKRWQTQLTGEMDYDVKNMMHTFRLLYSGLNIMKEGTPLVRFTGERLDHLMAIRRGEFRYQKLVDDAHALMEELETLRTGSKLREEADLQEVDRLLLSVTKRWEEDHA